MTERTQHPVAIAETQTMRVLQVNRASKGGWKRTLVVRIGVLALSALDCRPDTNLLGGGDSAGMLAGIPTTSLASALLLAPATGMTAVPMNLAVITLGFTQSVALADGASVIAVSGSSAAGPLPLGPPRATDCPDGPASRCLSVPLYAALAPATTYAVTLLPGLSDDAGHALVSGRVGEFTTAVALDLTPPTVLSLAIEPSGPCVLAHFETDEPASGRVILRVEGDEREIAAGTAASEFSAAVNLTGSPDGAVVQIYARAIDLAGNVGESAAVELPRATAPPPLAITEIRANPAGPEPAQEFVELTNLGAAPIELAGLLLEDEKGRDVLPATLIRPGEYVLVVSSGFDASNPTDTPPAPGTRLVRVDSRLGADGLSNAGEPVRLRGTDGRLISSYGAAIPVSAAAWAGKSVHRVPENACDQSATWTHRPEPSTPGWGPP